MPTIDQLPGAAQAVGTADLLPIVQLIDGVYVTGRAPLGTLLALLLNQGANTTVPLLPSGVPPGVSDNVVMVQGGTADLVPYSQFLNAETIAQLQAAGPASSTDVLPVAQGSGILLVQTFAAIWTWLQTQLPAYLVPNVEITADKVIDNTYNGKLLIISAAVTLSPNSVLMGNGFQCQVLAVGSGSVTFASNVVVSSGSQTVSPGVLTTLVGLSYSGGSLVFASVAGGGSVGGSAPGIPTGLTAGTPANTAMPLSWTAPSGSVSSYTVRYALHDTTDWTTIAGITGDSYEITGLTIGTEYDFEIAAINLFGSSAFTAVTSATTSSGYSLTVQFGNLAPTTPVSHTGLWPSGGLNFYTSTTPPDGATGWIAYSSGSGTPPTTGLIGGVSGGSGGSGYGADGFGIYLSPPASAGTRYVWAIVLDSSDNVLGAVVSQAITVT